MSMDLAKAKNIKVAVQRMMADPDAKAFLEAVCHFRKPLWIGNTEGALVAEGQRQIFLTLLTINEVEPDVIVRLYEEKGDQP